MVALDFCDPQEHTAMYMQECKCIMPKICQNGVLSVGTLSKNHFAAYLALQAVVWSKLGRTRLL